ncbi:hypothetical protein ANCCAN_14246 [Ancylostoma caninum]|uniref:Uncharacterized protein n=1 Tax=Ancylostoma caninum TaxID=29170 RepID=A0A368G636_ANCCA|nr:hypothetical protein ANCCAN_14246 [Ancylostoma caninum]
MQTYGDPPSLTQTRPAQQPTKTVLQLQNRASRTNSIDISSKVDLNENHLSSERPAYARRFMQNRSETVAPLLTRPSIDDGLTPLFNMNEKLKEPAHFVLPPLPLGLRPPSPEPRNLLLNAPKKRRVSSSNAFDLSCLSRMLRPYQSKSHSQKRPVCRVLRFGD